MFKTRFLSLLVLLCLTVSGAWAGEAPLLITIENTGDNTSFTSGSKTFDNIATVTFSGEVSNDTGNYGWYSGGCTLTVTAAEGYTITGVKFYTGEGGGSGFDYEAPFEAILLFDENNGYHVKVNGTLIGYGGLNKIEVYGYADTPPTTYDVTMKEGTLDATSWQGKAGEGEYQALPLEGVAAGTAVTVKYNGRKKVKNITIEKADPLAVPLTMEALTDGNIVVNIMNVGGKGGGVYPGSSKGGPGRRGSSNIRVKYSVNGEDMITIYETTTEPTTIPVNAGDKVQFYGDVTSTQFHGDEPKVVLRGTAETKVYGNIMSLIDETGYATLTTLPDGSFANFAGLFYMNENLTDASGLLLPATTLAAGCYYGMFAGCTSLTTAPALPATALTEQCYFMMFLGCTSLTTAPALPATELADQCYAYMFYGCTGLTTAPALPAETLAVGCYYQMFSDCTNLTTAPALPAETLASSCYDYMFSGCTSLTTAPVLPATTLADYCYNGMFYGCTSLTTAPTLPATTLAEACYNSMFSGCTSLSSITCLATSGINENGSTNYWVNGVASTGTFTKASGSTWPTGNNGIPSGWTVETPAPAGPLATPLTLEALTDGTIVVNISYPGGKGGGVYPGSSKGGPSTISMKYSVNNGERTLINTDNTTTIEVDAGDKVQFYSNGPDMSNYGFPDIAGGTAQVKVYGNIMSMLDEDNYATLTTLQDLAFYALFGGNTNLTDASGLLLPATTLATGCYGGLFYGCTSLTAAPELPATTLAAGCYARMFSGCTSLTTAPALLATELAGTCYDNMFSGCTSLTTAPALPATELAGDCYYEMFADCTSLTTAPTLPATTLASDCYLNMFKGCTSLTTAPALPATSLADYCYSSMFEGCTSLVTAPALPAETLASNCYRNMFKGCTSLTTAPVLPATTLANYCYRGMFSGCTSLTTAPVLPATTLAAACYNFMFNGCTSLNSVTCLATNISASNCINSWLQNVAATGTFTKASGSTWPEGANGIPSGWTVNEQ